MISTIHEEKTQNGHNGIDTGDRNDINRLVLETKSEVQEDYIWSIGPEELYQKTREYYKTEQDKIANEHLIQLFNE